MIQGQLLPIGNTNMAPKKNPNLLTVTEAAKELGVLRQGVLMAIYRGRLEAHQYGNAYLIERRVLERYRATTKIGRPPRTKKTKPSARRSKKKSRP